MESDWSGRWNLVRKFVERGGPFAHPDFEPSTEVSTVIEDPRPTVNEKRCLDVVFISKSKEYHLTGG